MPIPLQEAKNHERKNALSPFGPSPYMVEVKDEWEVLKDLKPDLILFSPTRDFVSQGRAFREWLDKHNSKVPVILGYSKGFNIMQAAAELGALFCEGFGNGIYIKSEAPAEQRVNLSFNILQAARLRITKTDFISCPSCGRTLFDLQEVTQKIKEKTAHLDGVKIAIMGCIVNGPGEMADADFGYVGSKPEKIDLYVGKTVVAKDIDFHEGPDKLVELIKSHGRWQEPA
jgi:(E)-4-hydroxy-3-methylbut-2-enyl-diphosphate synthase